MTRRTRTHKTRLAMSRGVTLVELMVSLVIFGFVTLAAFSMYATSVASYRTTDANQELQDNARFIFEVFSQSVRQAGLQDNAQHAIFRQKGGSNLLAPAATWKKGDAPGEFGDQHALFGSNNAKVASVSNVDDYGTDDNGGHNASDVFGVRFFGASQRDDITKADNSMIDCRGVGVPYPTDAADVGLSLLQVAVSVSGEPELQCINNARAAQPIVSGVESLQVLYAVDTNPATDTSPNRWLDAAGVTAAAAWPNVRTVRVGMVLRGRIGSGGPSNGQDIYPLGEEFSKVSGAVPNIAGLKFTPPNDSRLRRAFAFNITVRNSLEQ